MSLKNWFYSRASIAFVVLFLLPSCLLVNANTRPNIILILADDLGYSDLGCYGGEIHTPNLDKLAANGLRMTQLYNTARCCSTRASLLTGLYAHQAGVGAMSADNHLPGYRGFLTDRSVTIAEVLKKAEYNTYLSGKWHLRGNGNPKCTPVNRGFDEFFGHFKAYASFYRPDIYYRLPKDRPQPQFGKDFYATNAITDYALKFIQHSRSKSSPYFLYLAYNAPHFPLQAPLEMIEKYVKQYEKGWDEIRVNRHRQMMEMGILNGGVELSPRGHVTKVPNRNQSSPYYDKSIPAWTSLSCERRADLTRRMAIYAAMVEIMDHNIGRVVADLKKHNELENTLLVFLSDNGACAEWDPLGFDDNPYPANRLHKGNELTNMGQKGTFHSYGTGWANACNTPFRLYKHYNHEGGISSPFILHWPAGTDRKGEVDHQPAHLVDLSATILEVAEAEYPQTWKGNPILPLAGRSLQPVLKSKPLQERPIFFEHEGNRAVRKGNWKIVWTNFDKKWELYDISNDRSEMKDLSNQFPELVKQLSDLWHQWAETHFVEKEQVKQPAKGMPRIYYFQYPD
jgi:arylsulfatase A-like enzyme